MRELELTETWRTDLVFCVHTDKVKSSWIWVAACEKERERCAGWSPGGHFPSSMDRLLTFWLAAGLTLPVHHWALSIPQHLETAHKFRGPSMNSASQHPLKELHHTTIKKNSSISLTLISLLAKVAETNDSEHSALQKKLSADSLPRSSPAVSFCFISPPTCCWQDWIESRPDDSSKFCLKNSNSGMFSDRTFHTFLCLHFNYFL